MGTEPVGGGHTPSIAGYQSRELVLRHRRGQVVTDSPLVFEKPSSDHCADGVAPQILRSGRATPVTVEARDGVGATRLQRATQDVSVDHGPSIADEPNPVGPIDCQMEDPK